ncbi:bifunctional methylenetetrahydrofolate dehydrogenase/methenyltetrahydrofolate cyclohydrolase FolD [Magnetovibrio sp. PR-2]|uniref:bifunctional methylenetetrahydrofolate dehydrogenase/methenyltetrahydrofolate cyclohydrolase FolD n=1 Tax=Magnetovibrio sp. PR-2 TaxID=3120356 RepID=UPI002FCE2EC0
MSDTNKIDGKAFAQSLRERVGAKVAKLKEQHDITPGLAVVLVGEDPASQVYVRNKGEQTKTAGMNSFEFRLDADALESDLLEVVEELNADPNVHGILVQLPLPDHMDEAKVINAINPDKDVDGFHVINSGRLATGQEAMIPCTPYGCLMLIKDALGDDLSGKRAIIVGRSNIVGKPMAQLLLDANCTVTISHSRTQDLPGEVKRADIVVAAVGRPQMVKGDWIKEGACVIDVGINRIPAPERGLNDKGEPKTRLVGDVDYESASQVAGAITPVPGGVGPMTIGVLLANTVTACCRINGVDEPEA